VDLWCEVDGILGIHIGRYTSPYCTADIVDGTAGEADRFGPAGQVNLERRFRALDQTEMTSRVDGDHVTHAALVARRVTPSAVI